MPFDAGALGQDLISSAVSGGLDYLAGTSAAKQQFKYQKKLYKHRYQWQTADMIKAGLNPMLAAGAGAPVPGSVSQADVADVGSKAVSAFQASRTARAQRENIEANTQSVNMDASLKEMDRMIKLASPEYRQAAEALDVAHGDWGPGTSAGAKERYNAGTELVKQQARQAVASADLAEINRDIGRQDLTVAQVKARYSDQLTALSARYNEAMAKAAENKLSESAADKAFWETVGGWGKSGEFSKQLLFVIAEIVRAMRDH